MIALLCKNIQYNGGLEIVTKRLNNGFSAKKINSKIYSLTDFDEKYVFCNKLKNTLKRTLLEKFKDDKVDSVIFQLENPYSSLADYNFIKLLVKNNISVRIVLHNSPKYFISYYRSYNESNLRYILRFIKMKLYWGPKGILFVKKTARIARFISISEGCKKELKKYFKVDSVVIPNVFEPPKTISNVCNKEKKLAFIGRIDFKQKNILFILDAWNKVNEKGLWTLHIIGNGDKKIIENYIEQKKIDNILLEEAKTSDEVVQYLNTNSILLLSSRYEGFPTVVVEATSQANAVISTKYDGFSDELIKDSFNGYVVEKNDKIFADKIEKLLNDKKLLENMQNNSIIYYEKYKEKYNPIELWIQEFC